MAEINDKGIRKTIINISRNTPVALVVGASGFLGSNLVDKLLSKKIQVIGVDNFSTGKKSNLMYATKSSYFHLLSEDAQDLELEVNKLDYIFIVTSDGWNLQNILKAFEKTRARLLFASYINLYSDKDISGKLDWYKDAEIEIARFAKAKDLNARVLRMGALYGPRMHFSEDDPIVKLINEALSDDLQKDTPLEFSTRALFISDAVDLIVRCMLSGATAQRIFDAVSPTPVKMAELKQVLLDPVWYEQKGFKPSELPPWVTPNLEKTMRFLNWQPNTDLVQSLKQTLSYFKDNEISVPKVEDGRKWVSEKKVQLEEFKKEKMEEKKPEKIKKGGGDIKFSFPYKKFYFLLVATIVIYAFVWPIVATTFGVLTFKYQIGEAIKNLEKGEFDSSINNISLAEIGVKKTETMFNSFGILRNLNVFNNFFKTGDGLIEFANLTSDSTKNTVLGIQSLYSALQSVTGENADSPKNSFDYALTYLSKADEDIEKAKALTTDKNFSKGVPAILKDRVDSLSKKLSDYSTLVKKGRAITSLLPGLVAVDGQKSYLVLLQNNMELRPTGGFIGSYAKVSFEGGKLKKLEVDDIYNIDGQLKIIVEPPAEIKNDLGQKYWYLRDSNWEPDFPSAARQAEWFYTKETGERVDGTFALDISAIENLLSVLGPLYLSDYNESITSENLFQKAVSHAEISFFPGSQAKKSFLTSITTEVLNKLFFVPHQNWPGIVASLGKSLEQKHLSMFLNDPKLFSYLVSQNWTNALPRQPLQASDVVQDFLAPVEANFGANKANFYLDRTFNLETVIGKDGEVNQTLRIAYLNRSPSNTFPAGTYKNRFRVYLPFGAKLNKALWAETDITKDVAGFVDYGRTGYSLLIELLPKEQKTLVLSYTLAQKLQFKDGLAKYRLDVVKQAGTLKDPFKWTISFPINYRLATQQGKNIGPQEQTIETDLSVDRSFEVEFKR